MVLRFFFFNDTATTEIYTLSLHDALPIWSQTYAGLVPLTLTKFFRYLLLLSARASLPAVDLTSHRGGTTRTSCRSEEHTSELQSRQYLVCRLLLEKKKHKFKVCQPTDSTS